MFHLVKMVEWNLLFNHCLKNNCAKFENLFLVTNKIPNNDVANTNGAISENSGK